MLDSDEEDEPIAYTLAENPDTRNTLVPMTPEAMRRQYQKVKDSEGFESDAYALSGRATYLGPCRLTPELLIDRMDSLRSHCDTAIQHYNIAHGTSLKLVEVVKANSQTVYNELIGKEFYITFTAAAEDSEAISLYQAKVLRTFTSPPVLKVFICRPKPIYSS